MNKQPKALILADKLGHEYKYLISARGIAADPTINNVILELRRLHDVNAELVEALKLGLSACRSVSLHHSRKIVDGDGEFNYWQTGEWCEWLDGEVTKTLDAAIAKGESE